MAAAAGNVAVYDVRPGEVNHVQKLRGRVLLPNLAQRLYYRMAMYCLRVFVGYRNHSGRCGVRENSSWRTEHELQFIKHLGCNMWSKESGSVRSKTRRQLLQRYLRASNFRDNWEGISRVQVVGFAEQCLEQT